MRLALFVTFILAALPAFAQEAPLVSLQTGNDAKGWNAVGRLNLGNTGFCTGTLIAPDLVLTAAHCMFNKDTGARNDPRDIEFQAGLRNGRAEAYRHVARAIVHPDYIYSGESDLDRTAYDIALLQLDQPIRQPNILPIATATPPNMGDSVGVVSYAQDRAEAPSLQQTCHVLETTGKVLVLSCDVDFGSSGAPIFAIRDGVPEVVSVVSAKAEVEGKKVSLGMALQDPLATLMAEMAKDSAPVTVAGSQVTTLSGGRASGAKFLKP